MRVGSLDLVNIFNEQNIKLGVCLKLEVFYVGLHSFGVGCEESEDMQEGEECCELHSE